MRRFEERQSAQELCKALEQEGFAIELGVAGICEKKPVTVGGKGHGCGHHTLGAGALDAVELMNVGVNYQRRQGALHDIRL